ncbi:MaoC family dehydratase N-terminal domain-containing protein [Bacillus sp. JJ722]|uniref:MaoC family dehydratase N-terminal domain-containing protein n=1 Tax=Bacillus sp. JJ722 TaxID=3122973 RepID=UPI002FFE82A1
MSNVKDLIGVEYEPYSMAVEKGKIKELALALGDDNPIYFDLEAAKKEGYENIPMPPTYLQVIDLWGGLGSVEKVEKLKLNLVRVLHGQQSYEYLGDIVAGDILYVTGKVVDAETKSGSTGAMDFITSEYYYKNQRDELVAIARSTLVHRH